MHTLLLLGKNNNFMLYQLQQIMRVENQHVYQKQYILDFWGNIFYTHQRLLLLCVDIYAMAVCLYQSGMMCMIESW